MYLTRKTILFTTLFSLFSLTVLFSFTEQRARVKPDQFKNSAAPNIQSSNKRAELTLESFEGSFPPPGWSKITNFGGVGWQKALDGDDVPGFEAPAPVDLPPGGGTAIALASWATGDADGNFNTGQPTEQFLITPMLTNVQTADTLRFFLSYYSQFNDNLSVLISTSVNDVADSFNILVDEIGFVGAGNNAWLQYSYALADFVDEGSDIFIAFREHVDDTAVEGDALLLDLVEVSSLVTAVRQTEAFPNEFSLAQNFPNPFNPTTNIAFTLPRSMAVTLKIYNLLGQQVAIMVENKLFEAGGHQLPFDASGLQSGIYYYRIEADDFTMTRRMLLLQ